MNLKLEPRPTSVPHLRALGTAGVHFLFSAVLGVTVLFFVMADALATPVEGPPPWWLALMDRLLLAVNAPMAGLFGLWDDTHMLRLPLLLLAAAWSLAVGYAVSLIWQRVESLTRLHAKASRA
jgi:hypothetical protein